MEGTNTITIEDLAERLSKLEAKFSSFKDAKPKTKKTTPKVSYDPMAASEILEKIRTKEYICVHKNPSGEHKGLFCSKKASSITVNNIQQTLKEFLKENNDEVRENLYCELKCSRHKNTANKGKEEINTLLNGVAKKEVTTEEEITADQASAGFLSGLPSEDLTSPSRAKNNIEKDIKLGKGEEDFTYSLLRHNGTNVVIRRKNKKDGTPSKRSPIIVGQLEDFSEEADNDNFKEMLKPVDANIVKRLGFKYEFLESDKKEEVNAGLTSFDLPSVKTEKDAYEAKTDNEEEEEEDEELNKILDDLDDH